MAVIKQYSTKDGATRYEFRVYVGRDTEGRKRYVHRSGFTTQKAANLAASRITLDNSQAGRVTANARMTFADVYNEWYQGYQNTVRDSTYLNRAGDARVVLPAIGSIKLTKLTAARIQAEVNVWAKTTVEAYANRFNLIKRVLDYAVRAGYITRNPAQMVVKPKRRESDKAQGLKFWDRDELARFFGVIDRQQFPQQFAYFRVLAFGGLRRGEAEALTWADISHSNGTVSIDKTKAHDKNGGYKVNPPKTQASIRVIPLDRATLSALQSWHVKQLALLMSRGINGNQPGQLIFPSPKTNGLMGQSTPELWLNKFTVAAGLSNNRITLHGFRHSHASALFAAGASIKDVQTRLGHGDAQTTLNVYTHVTQNQSQQAADKLASYLNF